MNRTLIREMLPIMDPDEDYLTIVAAEESIGASEARRKKELEEAHANLRGAFHVCIHSNTQADFWMRARSSIQSPRSSAHILDASRICAV